jgi:hypothetical protein
MKTFLLSFLVAFFIGMTSLTFAYIAKELSGGAHFLDAMFREAIESAQVINEKIESELEDLSQLEKDAAELEVMELNRE